VAGQPLGPVDTDFAVYFHEGSNNFEFVYALTGTGPSAAGASATVGAQAATTGTVYTQYSTGAPSLSPGQMISASISPAVCSAGNGPCLTTSAPASVAGRVVTADGRGIRNARVSLIGSDGKQRTVPTNSFGFFRFEGVPAGNSYAISVLARGYEFDSRLLDLMDNISDLTFVPAR